MQGISCPRRDLDLLHATANNTAARAVVDHAFPVGGSCTDVSTVYIIPYLLDPILALGVVVHRGYVTAVVLL